MQVASALRFLRRLLGPPGDRNPPHQRGGEDHGERQHVVALGRGREAPEDERADPLPPVTACPGPDDPVELGLGVEALRKRRAVGEGQRSEPGPGERHADQPISPPRSERQDRCAR